MNPGDAAAGAEADWSPSAASRSCGPGSGSELSGWLDGPQASCLIQPRLPRNLAEFSFEEQNRATFRVPLRRKKMVLKTQEEDGESGRPRRALWS